MTEVRELNALLTEPLPASFDANWKLKSFQSGDCISYIAWNTKTREALVIDPKDADTDAYWSVIQKLAEGAKYLWLGVVDTHTHADHISVAADLATKLGAPLVMHHAAPSRRVDLRIAHATSLPAHSAPVRLIPTPGHTQDSITVVWGPFVFGGDTLLFGDVGRDDLPGGDANAHYTSLQALKTELKPDQIVLPGHDHKGGRASSWADQLKINTSLTQSQADYVREANAFSAPAPALLKESLRENFK